MSRGVLSPAQSFQHSGRRISFRSYGSGSRVVVLTHGLLMDGRMFTNLAPALARRGYRVITVDMLGHGESDHPHDMHQHSMTQYGRDVVALLDHLGIDQAVIGGTSLGANVALEVAVASPHRVRALVLEMPVLENGLAAAAAVFVPLAFALRLSLRSVRWVTALARKLPRSHFLVDMLIDFARRDPASSLAVLDGITFGRVAPPRDARRLIGHPTLVIGHRSDPVHPFSDADTLARELSDARLVAATSILEWRVAPDRLDCELCDFLAEAWTERRAARAS